MKRYVFIAALVLCNMQACESAPQVDPAMCACGNAASACTCAAAVGAADSGEPVPPAPVAVPMEPAEVHMVDLSVPNPMDMIRSNSGTYFVDYQVVEATQIPTNEPFMLRVRVFDATTLAPIHDGLTLSADAAMPHHGHGMIREPSVQLMPGGSFLVSGMLFHMVGRWELYFDLTRDGVTDRAQTEVFLE